MTAPFFGPQSRSRLYHSVGDNNLLPRSWDTTITAAGAEGDTWTVTANGTEVEYEVQALDDAAAVAAGLRTACAAIPLCVVTGATTHVILTFPAPNGPEDPVILPPVYEVDVAGGTSSTAVVGASSVRGYGVMTLTES